MLLGFLLLLRSCDIEVPSVAWGDVCPKEVQVQVECDAWAEHFRLIGEGTGSVEDRVWANVPSYSPMDAVWGNAPAPNELRAALRQMSLGKAGEDEVTADVTHRGRSWGRGGSRTLLSGLSGRKLDL